MLPLAFIYNEKSSTPFSFVPTPHKGKFCMVPYAENEASKIIAFERSENAY
mgnify:CR=1 FL=1